MGHSRHSGRAPTTSDLPGVQTFSGSAGRSVSCHKRHRRLGLTFTASLRYKDAAYAVAGSEPARRHAVNGPRRAAEAYARAKAVAPDDGEAKMSEMVSRPKGAT
jgi:hypothetical protein